MFGSDIIAIDIDQKNSLQYTHLFYIFELIENIIAS